MTKTQLQEELKSKIKPGTKPSDLKKLKRSKSTGDIPNQPPSPLLQAQLTEKQKELESLRKQGEDSAKQIEALNQQLTETQTQLDESQQARYQNLKNWEQECEKNKSLNKELAETIEESAKEITNQDKTLTNLRQQLYQVKSQKAELEMKLNRERIKRNSSAHPELTSPNDNFLTNLKYALYALLTVWFLALLNNLRKPYQTTWPT